jgi:branched-chain amino acid aminotransferase
MASSYCFFKGKIIPLEEAKVGVMTHALHYGTAVFEGIRGNWNEDKGQIYIFRLREHYQRLMNGCKLLNINLPYSVDNLCEITVEVLKKSQIKEDTYIRPLAYKSSETMGVRLHNLDNDFLVFAIPFGAYLDMDTARCCVSSWHRPPDNVIPPQAKATGIYLNNALCKTEAMSNGFDEGIMLSPDGYVSEGSGENIFLVMDGKLITPSVANSVLNGITRNTIIELAKNELGMETQQRTITRYELYTADECFLSGTAAHVTPVSEIDRRKLGNGEVGEKTAALRKLYFEVIRGQNKKYLHWCTPVFD